MFLQQVLALSVAATATFLVEAEPVQPNFIVMQPDDMLWLEAWGGAAHFQRDDESEWVQVPATSLIPNLERLRTQGVQMKEAYTASPMCGTSRYSTMTGRYPSRSSVGRDGASELQRVTIPSTKLENNDAVPDGLDCSTGNLASAFLGSQQYATGMIGKWHLTSSDRDVAFEYEEIKQDIRDCGFDYAEAIYPENLNSAWTEGYDEIGHNMEHLTSRALEFMESAISLQQPFFLYFNPTVPHGTLQ